MKLWCVNYATCFSYHTHSKLFLREEEAQKFYNSCPENSYHSIGRVTDIWSWCACNFEEVLDLIMSQHFVCEDNCGEAVYDISTLAQDITDEITEDGIGVYSVILKKTRSSFDDNVNDYSLSVAWVYDNYLHHKMFTFEGVCDE